MTDELDRGEHDGVVNDGQVRGLGVHRNVSQEFAIMLSR